MGLDKNSEIETKMQSVSLNKEIIDIEESFNVCIIYHVETPLNPKV
jgi:hypothetical protein